MDSIDNLQPGDMVIFIDQEDLSGPISDIAGLVTGFDPNPNDERAVFIQFYGGDDFEAGPLRYYLSELNNFLIMGDIRIQNAS